MEIWKKEIVVELWRPQYDSEFPRFRTRRALHVISMDVSQSTHSSTPLCPCSCVSIIQSRVHILCYGTERGAKPRSSCHTSRARLHEYSGCRVGLCSRSLFSVLTLPGSFVIMAHSDDFPGTVEEFTTRCSCFRRVWVRHDIFSQSRIMLL